MAYTVALAEQALADRFIERLNNKIAEDKRFCVNHIEPWGQERLGVRALKNGAVPRWLLLLSGVRLTQSKLYCGQHPGSCAVEATRRNSCLEWDDWIQFNDLVNDVLDEMKGHAEVWSRPRELPLRGQSRSKFWIRKGGKRRLLWDWEEDDEGFRLNPIRRWDMGSDSQFNQEAST